ncbi:UDP-N-acetylglucosamine 2-epimerase (non-hydrolyzing) [Flavobacterium sp. LC2016-01]|uniref:non-hydrolyzing UDP-N-acetylglucosamine 2-epimerase n=1 Tax=Flavobacterium sp. LC2016-01 TaxID=2675876 RepID=UPI0012BADD2C|nr:UDP-N-acetylglucosamine 2-epimerase (non-hydrolyzing) [Flavobacterium sp. LC2016-01]MTH17509.1 UDP-N-acetylglucosamine 2-epimerase (non-hydrolyzing) [Flavobacterium sp. LC2016-01]
MIKILIVFGTRPEAIKMAPLVKEFQKHTDRFDVKVCVTAQHRQMLDQVLDFFDIIPDYDLNLMRPGQNLSQLTADVILGLKTVFEQFTPFYTFVHGDTTTSTAAALASFYAGVKVCHVEAGLRTYNKLSPFPEEMNRQLTGRLADIHFAPTYQSKENLLSEGTLENSVFVTGNTVIDALLYAKDKVELINDSQINFLKSIIDNSKDLVLVTGHRRENFGDGFINICKALKQLAAERNVQIIYPVHLNPNVIDPVHSILKDTESIHLIEPLAYPAFVWLMKKAKIIITDSGGVQEEAPSLGKPVLVMRDTTERPEAVEAGTVKLVGTNIDKILFEAKYLLDNPKEYQRMSLVHNPYGDGSTCAKIIECIQ